MVMRKENVKKASIEIVDGLKCVLEAQFSQRSKRSCVPILKVPIHRFCEIARKTEKRFKKEDPRYEISRFLGASSIARKKMGLVCSEEMNFPACDKHIDWRSLLKRGALWSSDRIWKENMRRSEACKKEINRAIKVKPIEKSNDYNKLLTSFETMRDWMHVSGYALPDYVWVTPKSMRTNVKKMFEFLASKEVRSVEDLDIKRREIQSW